MWRSLNRDPYAMSHPIYFGTVSIEPHRWRPDLPHLVHASAWIPRALEAGFNGYELWQRHYTDASSQEKAALASLASPPAVFSAYLSFEETDEAQTLRDRIGQAIRTTGARAVKFNLGTKPERRPEYVRQFRAWSATLPSTVELLYECHAGDVGDRPDTAQAILDELGLPNLAIIVHAFDISIEKLDGWFDRFPKLIRHIHVQQSHNGKWQRLDQDAARNKERCLYLRQRGFQGSLTIEFSEGVPQEQNPDILFDHVCADLRFLRANL